MVRYESGEEFAVLLITQHEKSSEVRKLIYNSTMFYEIRIKLTLPSQQNLQTPITNTDPLPIPQPTNDHSLIDLQDRKRALLKHSGRCFENHTGIVLPSMSEASDEEVDYGSFGIIENPNINFDQEWSTQEDGSVD